MQRRRVLAQLVGLVVAGRSEERRWPRPPGALPDDLAFRARCNGCGDCVRACPHGTIGWIWSGSARTPALDPNRVACRMCSDLPCVAACEEGALEAVPLEAVFFGLARVQPERCFVFQGPDCGACKPACPLGAIRLLGGRPEVDVERCTGCGMCRQDCPVWGKAIVVDV